MAARASRAFVFLWDSSFEFEREWSVKTLVPFYLDWAMGVWAHKQRTQPAAIILNCCLKISEVTMMWAYKWFDSIWIWKLWWLCRWWLSTGRGFAHISGDPRRERCQSLMTTWAEVWVWNLIVIARLHTFEMTVNTPYASWILSCAGIRGDMFIFVFASRFCLHYQLLRPWESPKLDERCHRGSAVGSVADIEDDIASFNII